MTFYRTDDPNYIEDETGAQWPKTDKNYGFPYPITIEPRPAVLPSEEPEHARNPYPGQRPAVPRSCGQLWVAEIEKCPRCGLGASDHPKGFGFGRQDTGRGDV